MNGAERDRQEHEEALKRFDGKHPEGKPEVERLPSTKRYPLRFTNWWGDHYHPSSRVRYQRRIRDY